MVTSNGRAVISGGVCLGALGYLLGYVELVALATACLIALVLASAVVLRPGRLAISRDITPVRVVRGDPSVGVLTVRNLSRGGQRIAAAERCGDEWIAVRVPRIPSRGSRKVAYRLPTHRRGVIAVGPLRWERSDMFGLLIRRQSIGAVERLYVHPRVHQVALPASGRVRQLESHRSETASQGSITFHTLREYAPGDDMRAIHWRSSARLGELMVREHIDTALPQTTVVLDTRTQSYDHRDRFEEAVDFAATLVVCAMRARSPMRLVTTGGLDVVAGGGDAEIREFLDQMSAVRPGDKGFAEIRDDVAHGSGNGTLVAVGGEMGGADIAALTALAHRHSGGVITRLVSPDRKAAAVQAHMPVLSAATAATLAEAWNEWVGQ